MQRWQQVPQPLVQPHRGSQHQTNVHAHAHELIERGRDGRVIQGGVAALLLVDFDQWLGDGVNERLVKENNR